MNPLQITFKPFVDTTTGLLGYGTWGKKGKTDPEVDSAYLTLYFYYFTEISKHNEDYLGNTLLTGYSKALLQFKTSVEGVYHRFPRKGINQDTTPLEGQFCDPRNLSRDNTTPIIISQGQFGKTQEAIHAYLQLLKRFSFFQNTHNHLGIKKTFADIATPDHHAMYIRSIIQSMPNTLETLILSVVLTPLMYFCDMFGLFSMILHVIHTRFIDPAHTGSELNHVAICCQRAIVSPTLVGNFANFVYAKFRGNMSQFGEESPIMNALFEFFTKGKRGHIMPPLDETARKAVSTYLDYKASK